MITASRPYAQALYDYAKENNIVISCSDSIKILANCINNKNVIPLFYASECAQSNIISLLLEIFSNIFEPYIINFIKLLAKYKRLKLIPTIYHLFIQYRQQDELLKKAKIITAWKISPFFLFEIQKKLEVRYQCSIALENIVDLSIIGGAVIRIDDHLIDYSLKGKINKLKNKLKTSVKHLNLF